ncbi:hypothetical protein D3C78_20190 [compost metagenome]
MRIFELVRRVSQLTKCPAKAIPKGSGYTSLSQFVTGISILIELPGKIQYRFTFASYAREHMHETIEKEYVDRVIKRVLGISVPKNLIAIPVLESHVKMIDSIKVIKYPQKLVGKVTEHMNGFISITGAYVEKETIIRINSQFSPNGSIHTDEHPRWLCNITTLTDMYQNPTNEQYWHEISFWVPKEVYFGKNLWIAWPHAAMMHIHNVWVPIDVLWMDYNLSKNISPLGEEYRLYTSNR